MLGLGLSGLVEAMQFGVVAGRDASLSDLVANTAGTATGWLMMAHRARLLWPPPATARRLGWAWFWLVAATVAFTLWGLQPDLPHGPWYGQWTTGRAEPEFFSGRVLDVRLNSLEVPHWRLPEALQRELADRAGDGVLLEVLVVLGATETDPRRLLSLATEEVRFLSLGTGGGDLSLGVRTKGARLRLLSPRFRLPAGLAGEPGDTVAIAAEYTATGDAAVHTDGPGGARAAGFRLGLLDPWVFLWPGSVPASPILWLLRVGTLLAYFGPFWLWRERGAAEKKTARLG